MNTSPFEYKVIDDCIVRINQATGKSMGEIHKDDIEQICWFITDLDEDLWKARKRNTLLQEKYEAILDDISNIIKKQ